MGKISKNDMFQRIKLCFDGRIDFRVTMLQQITPPGTDDIDVFFDIFRGLLAVITL